MDKNNRVELEKWPQRSLGSVPKQLSSLLPYHRAFAEAVLSVRSSFPLFWFPLCLES